MRPRMEFRRQAVGVVGDFAPSTATWHECCIRVIPTPASWTGRVLLGPVFERLDRERETLADTTRSAGGRLLLLGK